MNKKAGILSAVIILLILVAGYFLYQDRTNILKQQKLNACTQEAKICPDGSSVGRVGPKCEFALCLTEIVYKNSEYGFEITMPTSWQGYSIENQGWQGWVINTGEQKYTGVKMNLMQEDMEK